MKKSQNIYDDPVFFDGYKKLRENPDNANILIEKPALFALAPGLKGKTILDLGCGYGENCSEFHKRGAKRVVGVDLSERMLEAARTENPGIEFLQMDMNDLSPLRGTFDVVFSSLALHYIEDLERFALTVNRLLSDGGHFIFSQEHPLTTAPIMGASWEKDEDGNISHYRLTDYARDGERKTKWIVDGVVKYHRTFSTLLNAFLEKGFMIEKLTEPVPSKEILERLPGYQNDLHKPDFLLVKMKKLSRE